MVSTSEVRSIKEVSHFGYTCPIDMEMGGVFNLSHLSLKLMVLRRRGLSLYWTFKGLLI